MAGALAAAPLGLDFALTLCGRFWSERRRWVLPAALIAVAVWLSTTLSPFRDSPNAVWLNLIFLAVTLSIALGMIWRQARALSAGPARRALYGVLVGGLLVVVGGTSDLIPRQGMKIPEAGTLATLFFLAIVCAVVLRHHLLDIDGFVLRSVELLTLSALAAVLLWLVYRWVGDRGFAPFFIASLLVIVPLILLAPGLRLRTSSMLLPRDPLIHQLSEISRKLPSVTKRKDVHALFHTACKTLPPPIRLDLVLELDTKLVNLMRQERFLTLRFLSDVLVDARGARLEQFQYALAWMQEGGWDLAFGMSGEKGLVGAIAVGGPLPERYLSEAVAAAGTALANQAASCFERIDAIEASERDRSMIAIGKVAAGLAHEIRNPLAALRGAGQAMGSDSTTEQRSRMLQVIQDESSRLDSFVRDFLEFAVPRPLHHSAINLEALSRDAIRASQATGQTFSIIWNIDPELPPVSGDSELLRRAFDNLIRNALEAGGDQVTITVSVRQVGNATVEWSIADDGPGIVEGGIERMTEPYFTTKTSGSGLGLAMVRRVIEQHGGQLSVANRSKGGACFTMTFPVETA